MFLGNHDVSFDQRKDIEYRNAYYQKLKHKVVLEGQLIASNNKYGYQYLLYSLDENQDENNELSASDMKKLLTNCIYLEDSWIELFGYKIYGSPWCPAEPTSGDGFG